MKQIQSKPVAYKYDLMHLNTPSYASSVITWDTSKMGSITKNRVVKWLKSGVSRYRKGEAANMYTELRKRFGIPEFVLNKPQIGGKHERGGYIYWEYADEQLLYELNQVYQAERVIVRLEGSQKLHFHMPWYLTNEQLGEQGGYFYTNNLHDLTKVEQEIERMTHSPEMTSKRSEAVDFVLGGGTLTFTYGV